MEKKQKKEKKKLGLTTQVFIGLFAGLILGIFLCYVCLLYTSRCV